MAIHTFDLHEFYLKTDVDYFSQHVFGAPYSSIKGLLYPQPRYRAFVIEKRNGSPRVIREPTSRLKQIQVRLLEFLGSKTSKPKACVHGFVQDRSIVSNAKRHIDTRPYYLLNLDLEDFFQSIDFYRVRGVFRKPPFNLSHEVSTVLAQLCTYANSLPQGAPTSPMLSNLVCRSLDSELMALARRHRATYTRYADDLTFSFSVRDASRLPQNICTFDSGSLTIGQELKAIIQEKNNFRINSAKSRMSTRLSRMEVTGIKINEFPNIKRSFTDGIRGALSAWEKHGYENAQGAWVDRIAAGCDKPYEQQSWRRQTRGGGTPQLKNVLWGKLLYVRMVRGKDDPIYTKLAERYNILCLRERELTKSFLASSLPIGRIVRNSDDAERSLFVIEWFGDYLPPGASSPEMVGGQGTAFAYKSAEQLITCEHVLNCSQQDGTVVNFQSPHITGLKIVAKNPRTGMEFSLRVLHSDRHKDLAVLRIEKPDQLHRHFVGSEVAIHRNESGRLCGYPDWQGARLPNQVSSTVLSRYNRTALARFEISSLIRQGNSGGPYVDSLYRVAGVAQQGATQQSGNDECLCVIELDRWLDSLNQANDPMGADTEVKPIKNGVKE